MNHRRRSLAACLALISSGGDAVPPTDPRRPRRRLRRSAGGGSRDDGREESHEPAVDEALGFYDLTEMRDDERLDLIKKAYALTQYGHDVDWDALRERFVTTAWEGKRGSRHGSPDDSDDSLEQEYASNGSEDGSDDAYEGETDDTLSGDVVVDADQTLLDEDNGGVVASDDTLEQEYATVDDDGGNDDAYNGETDDTLSGDIVVDAEGRVVGSDDTLEQEYATFDGDEEEDKEQHSFMDGSDDVYDGKTDDTLGGDVTSPSPPLPIESPPALRTSRRRLQANSIDGDVFDGYEYSKGNCPNDGSRGVPCAPDNLASLCNKYDRDSGSFRACLDACKPAFCCIHDAPRVDNFLAENCNDDENCPQYNYCYIAWWKLHDTVGPALFLRVEQDDDFYDVDAEEIESDSTGDEFFTQVLLHHFDDISEVIADGTVDNEFNADRIFLDEDYWVYPVAGQVDMP